MYKANLDSYSSRPNTHQEIFNNPRIHLKTNTAHHNGHVIPYPNGEGGSTNSSGNMMDFYHKEWNAFNFKGFVSPLKFLSVPLVKDPCLIKMLQGIPFHNILSLSLSLSLNFLQPLCKWGCVRQPRLQRDTQGRGPVRKWAFCALCGKVWLLLAVLTTVWEPLAASGILCVTVSTGTFPKLWLCLILNFRNLKNTYSLGTHTQVVRIRKARTG